jgi:hypothetical protein
MTIKETYFYFILLQLQVKSSYQGRLNYQYISYKTESLPITLVQKIQCRRAFRNTKDENNKTKNLVLQCEFSDGYQFIRGRQQTVDL